MDFIIFLFLTVLFFGLLAVKRITHWEFCVICASVSITWLSFLGLRWLGYAINPMLIGILMGGSVVGVFYLVEKKVKDSWHIFRFPFLLTLMFGAYVLIAQDWAVTRTSVLIGFLWVTFGAIYAFRNYGSFSRIARNIIACCKRW